MPTSPKRSEKERESNPPPLVKAHCVLKGSGESLLSQESLPTSRNIGQKTASSETLKVATDALTELGFRVVGSSPLQVTIEGPVDKYEHVFKALIRQTPDKAGRPTTPKVKSAKPKTPKAATRPSEASSTQLEWRSTPQIPQILQDTIEEIVLPQSIKFL